jgi:DNA-binding NtrC family response regulator
MARLKKSDPETTKGSVVILVSKEQEQAHEIDWRQIGQLVHDLPELYRTVKESRLDVILIDESDVTITQSIATRIRRQDGLTEIWSLIDEEGSADEGGQRIDGELSYQLGQDGIRKRINQILADKERLARYGIVGRSNAMKTIAEMIERIAPTEVSVLIVGPSGSGKELVARALHDDSRRKRGPFVAFNCGALAEGVLESELFGHEKGAFTGSVSRREGLFHKAEGGTVFLDEIGEMKPDTQVKLLRVLEDGMYYPVGSSTPRRADVRVVAATNRDLTEAIAEKQFREDLYFRIGAVKIVVPPLLERKGDIQPLLQHFLVHQGKTEFSDSALSLLVRYDWPGNIRQLRNLATRMTALKPGGLVEVEDVERFISEQHATATHLPVSTGKTVEQAGQELIYRAIMSLGNEVKMLRDLITANLPRQSARAHVDEEPSMGRSATMEDMERALIEQVLAETGGNRKEAARRLGIGERTLYRKLNKYDLR